MTPDIPNYTLLRKLGAGAFADVWLAEHRNNRRKAAVKILKSSMAQGDAEALFLREGEVLASFNERNIVSIYDNAKVGDSAYLIMEYLAGGSLLDRMNQRGLEVGEAIGFVVQIAAALDAAHRQQIIHRDLKPANIMLRDETTPVLTDFGASRLLERSTIYGKDGGVVGTPHYMSPEQITGQTLDGRSDLYALGILFHELLTGRVPYNGTVNEILAQHLHGALPQLPANLTVLQPVLDRLLAKSPSDRFDSGSALADALRRCFLDQAALRQLVDFAPASAWSSQLKALGFNLDTAERTEVRIAQGEFLRQQAVAKPAPAAGSGLPDSMPTVPMAGAGNHRPLVQPALDLRSTTFRALNVGMAMTLLVLALGATLQLESRMEAAIIGSLGAVAAWFFGLAWLRSGYARGRGWSYAAAAGGVLALLALGAGLYYAHWAYSDDPKTHIWLVPAAWGAVLLGAVLALAWVLRSWVIGVAVGVPLVALWVLTALYADTSVASAILAWIGVLGTLAVWLTLALRTQGTPGGVDAPASSSMRKWVWLAALALVLPAAWPLGDQLRIRHSVGARVLGEWHGLSAVGPVRAEFESDGALWLYPTEAGRKPWVTRWLAGESMWGGSPEIQLLAEDDGNFRSEAEVPLDTPADLLGLQFPPSLYELFSTTRKAPFPLLLQRFPPGNEVDYSGFDQTLTYQCDVYSVRLQLGSNGSGWLELAGEAGPVRANLAWALFVVPDHRHGLHLVTHHLDTQALKIVGGWLASSEGYTTLRIRHVDRMDETACTPMVLP